MLVVSSCSLSSWVQGVCSPHHVNQGGVQKTTSQITLYESHTGEESLRRHRSERHNQVLSGHPEGTLSRVSSTTSDCHVSTLSCSLILLWSKNCESVSVWTVRLSLYPLPLPHPHPNLRGIFSETLSSELSYWSSSSPSVPDSVMSSSVFLSRTVLGMCLLTKFLFSITDSSSTTVLILYSSVNLDCWIQQSCVLNLVN